VETHVDSLATLATSLVQGLPRVILVEDLCKLTKMKKEMVQIHQIRVGPSWMDPIVLFLKRISCPRGNSRLIKCEGWLLGFGYLRTKSCTSTLFLGHTCYAYTLKRQSYSSKSYMKGFVEVIQEVGLYLTKLSLRDTGGQTCRRKHKNM